MYLSRFEMDIRNASVRQCLRDCDDMHRNIQLLFNADRQTENVLYRLRVQKGKVIVYVQSCTLPKESSDSRHNGMTLTGYRDISSLITDIKDGQCYSFNIMAFPSKKCSLKGHKNSQRKELFLDLEKIDWFKNKTDQNGMRVLSIVANRGDRCSSKRKNFVFSGTEFTGKLMITDFEKARCSIIKGIGPEKAYGMGLMILLRLIN